MSVPFNSRPGRQGRRRAAARFALARRTVAAPLAVALAGLSGPASAQPADSTRQLAPPGQQDPSRQADPSRQVVPSREAAPAGTSDAARPGKAASTGNSDEALDIAPGPLADTLNRYAIAAGITLTFAPAQTDGRQSPGLRGRFTVAEGFERLLAGSALQAVATGPGRYTLVSRPAAGATGPSSTAGDGVATTLPAVTVTDRRDALTEDSGSLTTAGPLTAATGLGLTLRETPQSMTVVTRERIDAQALTSLDALMAQVTGVHVVQGGTPIGGYNPLISRGYPIRSFLIDGLPMPANTFSTDGYGISSIDTAPYDSITVVRGATGLLSGAGDPSGSISLTRKRPTPTFEASVEHSLGRWRQHRTAADVGGPLNEAGNLRGRLVAAHSDGRSWVDRYRGDKTVVYGVLEADLGARTLLTVALQHNRTSSRAAGPEVGFAPVFGDGTPTPFGLSANAQADASRHDDRHTGITLRLDHRFNDDWKARLSISRLRYTVVGDRYVAEAGARAEDPLLMFLRPWRDWTTTDALVAQLDGRYQLFGRRHEAIVGISAARMRVWGDGGWGYTGLGPLAADWTGHAPVPDTRTLADFNVDDYTGRDTQSGLYFATRLRPTERLAVLLGGRWSHWRTLRNNRPASSNYDPDNTVADDRREKGVFVPYAGVTHDLSSTLTAYGSYTEIFNPQASKDVNGRALDPERGENYELGLKGQWFDGRLNASAAVFEVRKNNLAVRDGDRLTPTGDFAYRAEDDTRGRGWEFEVSGEVARGWQVQAGYTRMVLRDSGGSRLNVDYPVHQFKLFTLYTPTSLPQLTVGGGVWWQSRMDNSWWTKPSDPTTVRRALPWRTW